MSVDPTPAPMDCTDIERLLDPWLDGEIVGRDAEEAESHLAGCEPCRTEADRRRHVRDAVRATLRSAMGPGAPDGIAPEQLRLRIVEAIEHERRPLWRRIFAPLPVAAAAACLLGAMLVVAGHRAHDPLVEEAVQRHARDLPLEVTAASTGSDAVPAWFQGKLDFNPRPPHFSRPDIRLVGARLSHISDRPAAYMRYELPRGHIGLFIVEDHEGRLMPAPQLIGSESHQIRIVAMRGYNIAVWYRNGIAYSLVSDLDAAQLQHLVEPAAVEGR